MPSTIEQANMGKKRHSNYISWCIKEYTLYKFQVSPMTFFSCRKILFTVNYNPHDVNYMPCPRYCLYLTMMPYTLDFIKNPQSPFKLMFAAFDNTNMSRDAKVIVLWKNCFDKYIKVVILKKIKLNQNSYF